MSLCVCANEGDREEILMQGLCSHTSTTLSHTEQTNHGLQQTEEQRKTFQGEREMNQEGIERGRKLKRDGH